MRAAATEPGIEVNAVMDAVATEVDGREQRDADAEVLGGLLLGEAAGGDNLVIDNGFSRAVYATLR